MKDQAIRPLTPLDVEEAKRTTGDFIDYYNTTRLHSAIGFIAPKDRLEGRHQQIHTDRDKKLEEARRRRRIIRQALPQSDTEAETLRKRLVPVAREPQKSSPS